MFIFCTVSVHICSSKVHIQCIYQLGVLSKARTPLRYFDLILVGLTPIIGASLSEPHIVVLSRMSDQLVSVTSGIHLTYDRISKCKIVMLRRPPACLGQHAYKSPARQHRVEPATLYSLRQCYKLRSYYRLADLSWRERFSRQHGVLLSGTV